MGVLGLLGYVGLFASVALACVSRARRSAPRSLLRASGLGLLAATVCLFLADFSGTRFPAHTVTTYYWLLVGAYLGTADRPPVTDAREDPEGSDDHPDEPCWTDA